MKGFPRRVSLSITAGGLLVSFAALAQTPGGAQGVGQVSPSAASQAAMAQQLEAMRAELQALKKQVQAGQLAQPGKAPTTGGLKVEDFAGKTVSAPPPTVVAPVSQDGALTPALQQEMTQALEKLKKAQEEQQKALKDLEKDL